MAFVKDDHSYTRGPGAIAALDAVSPARARAVARAERALQIRDTLTQRALEGVHHGKPPPYHDPHDARGKTPPKGKRPPSRGSRIPSRGRGVDLFGGRFDTSHKPTVKLPGSVITPPAPGSASPTQSDTSTAAPPKTQTVVIGGGSGTSWTAPSSKGGGASTATDDNPPPDFAPEPEEAPAAAPAAKPASSKVLLYAALGIGAWWLLTRK